ASATSHHHRASIRRRTTKYPSVHSSCIARATVLPEKPGIAARLAYSDPAHTNTYDMGRGCGQSRAWENYPSCVLLGEAAHSQDATNPDARNTDPPSNQLRALPGHRMQSDRGPPEFV